MARIYTKTGDEGETGLFGGGRVPKDDPRVAAYGDVDELNAAVGFAASLDPQGSDGAFLQTIQRDLFMIESPRVACGSFAGPLIHLSTASGGPPLTVENATRG